MHGEGALENCFINQVNYLVRKTSITCIHMQQPLQQDNLERLLPNQLLLLDEVLQQQYKHGYNRLPPLVKKPRCMRWAANPLVNKSCVIENDKYL
jgi:hypothetical protein